MKKNTLLACLLLLSGCLFTVGALPAAPVPAEGFPALKEVPASVPLLIHVRGVRGTLDRIINLLKQVSDQGQIAGAFLENGLENGLDGRKLRGIEKDGPIFLAFSEFPGNPQDMEKAAVIVRVTNFVEFRDNLLKEEERKGLKKNEAGYESTPLEDGKALYFLDHKDYAIVTGSKETALAFTKKAPGLDTVISKELGSKFLASDLGVYLSMDPVNKKYADQIKEARKTIDDLLKSSLENNPNPSVKAQMETMAKAIPPMFQAVQDSKGLLVSFEFRPQGLAFHAQTESRTGTKTQVLMEGAGVSPFKELDEMPAGLMFYTASKASPSMFKMMGGILFGVFGDLDSAEMKAVKTAFDSLIKAQPSTGLGGMSLPPHGLQIWNYVDPKKGLESQLSLIENLTGGNTYVSGLLKGKPVIKPKANQFKGIDFTSVKMVWDTEKMKEQNQFPEAQKKAMDAMMEKLIGTEANIWMGSDDKRVIQVTAKDWPAAEKILEGFLKTKTPVGPEGNFMDVRKNLPPQASLAGIFDLVKYVGLVMEMTKPILENVVPLPANYPPEFKGKPSFVGMSVGMESNRGQVDFYISAQAVHDVFVTFVQPFIGK